MRLSKISALNNCPFAVELPVRLVSSFPSDIWLPPKTKSTTGTVVIVLPSIAQTTFVPSLVMDHVCHAKPSVPAAVLPPWVVGANVDWAAGPVWLGTAW